MKTITVKGQKRESVGKASTKALRNAELVPCVVYGVDQALAFSTEEKSFKDLVYTSDAHFVDIQLENGDSYKAILQDVQFHPVTDKILHADFYQITDDKPLTMEIPVRLEGRARGVINGGTLRFNMRKLKIKAIPVNLPDEIVIDISPLKIGQKVYIESLRKDEYSLLHPDNGVVVAVRRSRVSVEEEEDEETEEGVEEGAEGSDAKESGGDDGANNSGEG